MKKYSGKSRRSYRRGRRVSKWQPLATYSKTSYRTNTLYSALPAQMKVALRSYRNDSVAINLNAYVVQPNLVPLSNPSGGPQTQGAGATSLPEYFYTLMSMYGRSCVDRVQIKITLTNTGNAPITGVMAVTPVSDPTATTTNYYERLRAYPESKSFYLGTSGGGHDLKTMYYDVDVKKFINYQDETPFCSTSTLTTAAAAQGVLALTLPTAAQIPTAPAIVYCLLNQSLTTNTTVTLALDYTYHLTFSSRHAGNTINFAY